MVKNKLHFHVRIAGPYSLFSDGFGEYIVGREVNVSSQSSEVSKFLSNAPRFSSIGEFMFMRPPYEVKEYTRIERINFSYSGYMAGTGYGYEPRYIIIDGIFHAVINVFGGMRGFMQDMRSAGGYLDTDVGFDENGVHYDKLSDYCLKMTLLGSETERLMKLEGLGLW